MAETSIQWTDATWNPTRGCTVCSPGCKHCYAMKIAARFSGKGLAYQGLAFKHPKAGGQWTGKVRLVEEQLDAPLRWSRPRRIFVNSMSDLFHEALPVEAIADVFAVMYLAPRHTFQVLTKRAHRMREILNAPWFYRLVLDRAEPLRAQRPKLMGVGISDPTKFPAPWVSFNMVVVPKNLRGPSAAALGQLLVEGLRRHHVELSGRAVQITVEPITVCRKCSCSEERACEGGCYWVESDLCSKCTPEKLAAKGEGR